jgi:hypothetical protein
MELLLPCTGNCRETMIEVVPAIRYDEAALERADLQIRMQALQAVLLRLLEQPSGIGSQPAFLGLQLEAREALRTALSDQSAAGDDKDPVSPSIGWLCSECGRFEAPQPCLGVCIRRRSEAVPLAAYEAVVEQLEETRGQLGRLTSLVRRLAWVTPREGTWQSTQSALQSRATTLLATLPVEVGAEL